MQVELLTSSSDPLFASLGLVAGCGELLKDISEFYLVFQACTSSGMHCLSAIGEDSEIQGPAPWLVPRF